jgi:putative SOS response-associated peptidase YedK
MPMALIEENRDAWLDPRTDAHTATDLMAPPAAGSPDIYALTKAVNNVRNNGPELLAPPEEF